MKRNIRQRKRGNTEMPSIAAQCMQEVYHGRNVIDFLQGKGSADPVSECYDIRRWIKSNDPDSYASIPMNLRLELPVHNDNPPPEDEKKEETKMEEEKNLEGFETVEVRKKKPGRKPKQKTDGNTIVTVRNQRKPEKTFSRVQINSVSGVAARYEWDGSEIRITSNDDGSILTLEFSRLQEMLEELPEVIELLER